MKKYALGLAGIILGTGIAAAQEEHMAPPITEAEVGTLVEEYEESPVEFSLPGGEDEIIEFVIETESGDSITEGEVENALQQLQGELSAYAKSYLGTPYVWGAKGPKRFDCSGFTNWVFKNFGYDIGHGTKNQVTQGKKVGLQEARVGDLMFFTRPGSGKNVGHVGMVIDVDAENGTLKFIHASSKKGVTIQQYPDNGYYNRRFLQVRRVINDNNIASA